MAQEAIKRYRINNCGSSMGETTTLEKSALDIAFRVVGSDRRKEYEKPGSKPSLGDVGGNNGWDAIRSYYARSDYSSPS